MRRVKFAIISIGLLMFLWFASSPRHDYQSQTKERVNQIKLHSIQPLHQEKARAHSLSMSRNIPATPKNPSISSSHSPFTPRVFTGAVALNQTDNKPPTLRPHAHVRSEIIHLHYAKAKILAALLKDNNTALLSKRGILLADARTNSLWIKDRVSKIKMIHSLVKHLDVPVRQVLIESRIVDVTQDVVQDLGIRFGMTHPSIGGDGALTQPAEQTRPLAERLTLDLPVHPAFGQAASLGIALAQLGDNILLDLELSALESEGRAEVIASPRLMTADQQEALIEAGQEIPYQQSMYSGATAVAFKKAALSLKVTPHITPDGRVLMRLKINQDRPSAQLYNGVPAIITKEIDTNVLVKSGQTIVLGGIYQRDKGNNVVRVPFFGKLPYVGALFRRTSVVEKNEELLIFITPKMLTFADEKGVNESQKE